QERAGTVHGGSAAGPGRVAPAVRRRRCARHRHLPHSHGADAGSAGAGAMKSCWLAAALLAVAAPLAANGQAPSAADPTFQLDFSDPGLSPSQWTLTLRPD